MAYDLALDGTGDLLFTGIHDLQGATGDVLTQQRILLRCKIPRGGWAYDEDGTLGSRLATISRSPSAKQLQEAPSLVMEALEPMDDISVQDVQVATDDDGRLVISVAYTNVSAEEEAVQSPDDTMPTIDAIMTI